MSLTSDRVPRLTAGSAAQGVEHQSLLFFDQGITGTSFEGGQLIPGSLLALPSYEPIRPMWRCGVTFSYSYIGYC